MQAAEREEVRSVSDVERVRQVVRRFAAALSFTPVAMEQVVLAATELATNLVRYAIRGTLEISEVAGAVGNGIQLASVDAGPGVSDVSWVMEDGTSTGGGLGSGLPAVRRLMDTFELTTSPSGTRIVVCKWPAARL